MTISSAMRGVLLAIAEHERTGAIGALPALFDRRTMTALTRRGLIEPNVDGSRRLTSEGWDYVESKKTCERCGGESQRRRRRCFTCRRLICADCTATVGFRQPQCEDCNR